MARPTWMKGGQEECVDGGHVLDFEGNAAFQAANMARVCTPQSTIQRPIE